MNLVSSSKKLNDEEYLLSPLLNHKELLLKISKFEANYFWNSPKNRVVQKTEFTFLPECKLNSAVQHSGIWVCEKQKKFEYICDGHWNVNGDWIDWEGYRALKIEAPFS